MRHDDDDRTTVSDDVIEQIKAKPEGERTGEEQSILGTDNAVNAAREALEAAGFDLDHIIIIIDAASTPDRTPDAATTAMVVSPHHDECAIQLLGACLVSLAHSAGMTISQGLFPGGGGPAPSGPIHHQ